MTIGTHAACRFWQTTPIKDRSKNLAKTPFTIDGVDYKILDAADRPSGYQGTAYQRVDTGDVVIAHRGTESLKDGITDAGMAVCRPQQPAR